jgi:zinc transporter ZupT
METFLTQLYADPLHYLGFVFAFAAAFAFLIFLRGFLSGSHHLFTLAGHDEYLYDSRRRATWGLFLLIAIFIVWEVVRWFFGLFD